MPPTYRIAKLEAKLDELRKVHGQYKHLDRLIIKNQDNGFIHRVLFDLWAATEKAVKEDDENPV